MGTPAENAVYWRKRLAGQGNLTAPPKTLGSVFENGLKRIAKSTGANEKASARFANRAMRLFNDATPVGNVTGAEEGARTLKRGVTKGEIGTAAAGLASLLLSVAPLPGGVKKPVKKKLADLIEDNSGAIRAWHGSPYDFDRFDMSKIGTGEGAQSYGHGLYFTDSKRLANSYRNAKMLPDVPADYGRLYEVDINAEPRDFIDLDASLLVQPDPIQGIAKDMDLSRLRSGRLKTMMERFAQGTEQVHYPATMNQLHSAFTDYGADEAANRQLSEMIANQGYSGFRFGQPKDALGGGGRNYIVFDPSIVDILGKY